jgi:hypothetical protein
MPIDHSPVACLNRATNQLSNNDDASDRYACLELRQCLEALAYKKLSAYANRVPQELFQTWQPAQVIELLSKLEPNSISDRAFTIYKEPRTEHSKPVHSFRQKEITATFISKRYHKLGHYLHVPTILQASNPVSPKFHGYLIKLRDELIEYVNSTTYCSIADIVQFKCLVCSRAIIRNIQSIKDGDLVECFDIACKATHKLKLQDGGEFTFSLHQSTFDCDCGNTIYMNTHRLRENTHVRCQSCEKKYLFEREWVVVPLQ